MDVRNRPRGLRQTQHGVVQQLTVRMPPEVVRELKVLAINSDSTLSELVTAACTAALSRGDSGPPSAA